MSETAAGGEVTRDWAQELEERTALVDAEVTLAAKPFLEACAGLRVAVACVGGYGRRELFPHSDIDLLVIARSEETLPAIKPQLTSFLQTLWDRGLRMSQSVRTVEECCTLNENNTELHISLLDLRFLAGDEALFRELAEALPAFYRRHKQVLVRSLSELTRTRHAKYNHTVYHLEPNIKETPGGIRDYHFLHWLNRLMPENEALGEALADAAQSRDFLYPLRIFLHRKVARDSNLLTFDLQDDASAQLAPRTDASEWMRRYFLVARRTWQACERALEFTESLDRSLFSHFRDRRSRFSTTDYTVSHDRVLLRNPGDVLLTAEATLDLFTFCARHRVALSWDAERRLRAQVDAIAANFATNPPRWEVWHELFRQPHASLALHEMQETGVLSAAIREWRTVDGLVVRDFYHRYTVDEHTLVAVGVIDDLVARTEGTAKRFQQLLCEVDDPAVLRLALLLHDIGKGTEPGEHVHGSMVTAEAVLDRMKVPPDIQRTVLFLIAHHLDLSSIMNGRDPDDPATARMLAVKAQTVEQLRYLALLTYADISAVNPTAMTPWRIEQLWRVYTMGQDQLTRDLDTDRIRSLSELPVEERTPQLARFLQGLPTRYLRTHTADEIRHQCEMQIMLREKKVAVEIFPSKGGYQATVLACGDRPGLFGSICGALASFGMNILKAEAFDNDSGLVVDQFRFADPLRTLELNPTELDRLRKTIERVVLGQEDVRHLLKRRRAQPRPARVAQIAPSVRFSNDASDVATLVDFIGEDRPGLLYELTTTIAANGCNIEIVLIDTEAHKAIDVFYVTCKGAKLDEATQEKLRAELLRAAERPLAPA